MKRASITLWIRRRQTERATTGQKPRTPRMDRHTISRKGLHFDTLLGNGIEYQQQHVSKLSLADLGLGLL
jgi:hypothetical protein